MRYRGGREFNEPSMSRHRTIVQRFVNHNFVYPWKKSDEPQSRNIQFHCYWLGTQRYQGRSERKVSELLSCVKTSLVLGDWPLKRGKVHLMHSQYWRISKCHSVNYHSSNSYFVKHTVGHPTQDKLTWTNHQEEERKRTRLFQRCTSLDYWRALWPGLHLAAGKSLTSSPLHHLCWHSQTMDAHLPSES